jgi:hypothetical protein
MSILEDEARMEKLGDFGNVYNVGIMGVVSHLLKLLICENHKKQTET